MIIECFGGVGGLRQAFALNRLQPGVSVLIEWNEDKARAALRHWSGTIHWRDITKVDAARVRTLIPFARRIKLIVIGGGFPCPEFSRLNVQRGGHQVAQLRSHIRRLAIECARIFTNCKVRRIYENVASMDDSEAFWLTADINRPAQEGSSLDTCRLFAMNNADLVPNSRPRYFWIDTGIASESDKVSVRREVVHPWKRSHACCFVKTTIKLHVSYPPRATWLDAKTEWNPLSDDAVLPTFVRAIPRKRPPPKPAGIYRCDEEVLDRYEADSFRYPPYQYKDEHLMHDKTLGVSMAPSPGMKEKLLMYPPGITRNLWTMTQKKKDPTGFRDAQNSALGDGFPCGIVAWIINRALISWGYKVPELDAQEMVDGYFLSFLEEEEEKQVFDPSKRSLDGLEMAHLLICRQTHVGGQLRCVPGKPFNCKQWPRQSVTGAWWHWKTVVSYQWMHSVPVNQPTQSEESINVLEARAILAALKWRAGRFSKMVGSRFVHLIDSQVCMGALNKFRSNSTRLNTIISRIAAITLASSSKIVYGYISTDQNPADNPSRRVVTGTGEYLVKQEWENDQDTPKQR